MAPPRFTVRPAGRVPKTSDQLYGVAPPEACNGWL